MKKTIIIMAATVAAFIAGWEYNDWYYNYDDLYNANLFKLELLKAEEEALGAADSLIDKHNLWDIDGSDTMSKYLKAMHKVDSLINTQI